jgi:zinc/manganese transport system substrate-binding protein
MYRATSLALLFVALLAPPVEASLKIFACEPEWAALARELGGEKVETFSATTARQDPHRIEARPSLIARLRQADLAVCTGAELEAGWLPVLLRQAGNHRVQPGQPGYFEAAAQVERLAVPKSLDRALGDLHASGNPHVHTDPRRLAIIAERLAARLAEVDPANAGFYRSRHAAFAHRWRMALTDWSARAIPLKGKRVVAHHKDWIYLYDWLGLVDAGTLEAKPGIPPSAAHLAELSARLAQTPAHLLLRTPYQDPRAAEWLAERTRLAVTVLPYTVGGDEHTQDLYALFEVTVRKLLEAAP